MVDTFVDSMKSREYVSSARLELLPEEMKMAPMHVQAKHIAGARLSKTSVGIEAAKRNL
jgi:hypothetical protein